MGRQKNHSVPVFYLNNWVGEDSKLTEFSRPRGKLFVARKHPVSTGFARGLYSFPEAGPEGQQYLEGEFLQGVDSRAATALKLMTDGRLDEVQGNLKVHWTRYLISMINRNPERVQWAKRELAELWKNKQEDLRVLYDQLRKPGDPSYDEYRRIEGPRQDARMTIVLIQRLMDLPTVGQALVEMPWYTIPIEDNPELLLTSDRPIIRPIGLGDSNGHLLMPISPRCLFVAAKRIGLVEELVAMGPRFLTAKINNYLCRGAAKYVWGRNERMQDFVDQRLNRYPDASYLATFFRNRKPRVS